MIKKLRPLAQIWQFWWRNRRSRYRWPFEPMEQPPYRLPDPIPLKYSVQRYRLLTLHGGPTFFSHPAGFDRPANPHRAASNKSARTTWAFSKWMLCLHISKMEDIIEDIMNHRYVQKLLYWRRWRRKITITLAPGRSVHRERANFRRLVLGWLAGWLVLGWFHWCP